MIRNVSIFPVHQHKEVQHSHYTANIQKSSKHLGKKQWGADIPLVPYRRRHRMEKKTESPQRVDMKTLMQCSRESGKEMFKNMQLP